MAKTSSKPWSSGSGSALGFEAAHWATTEKLRVKAPSDKTRAPAPLKSLERTI